MQAQLFRRIDAGQTAENGITMDSSKRRGRRMQDQSWRRTQRIWCYGAQHVAVRLLQIEGTPKESIALGCSS